MRKITTLILATGALILAWAVAMPLLIRAEPPETSIPNLKKILAREPPGWVTKDLPLGETELVKEAAEKTLRHDEFFFRSYRKGEWEITVYVAYWAPGKHPPHLVARHTPDLCWTLNGMVCEDQRSDFTLTTEGVPLWPGHWRKFRTGSGETLYTVFWHRVGDRSFSLALPSSNIPNPKEYMTEALRFAFARKQEQVFLRVTSSHPFEQIVADSGFQQAISGLTQLGIAR
jgi:hypothetical protein